MRFRLQGFLPYVAAIAFAVLIFTATSSAQFTVSVSTNVSSPIQSPANINVTAQVTLNPGILERVVFYRNDVPYKSFAGPGLNHVLQELTLGQDNYTYRARAYATDGSIADSNSILISVQTRQVFKMGTNGTMGPNRHHNHKPDLEAAIAALGANGGTVYFPCTNDLNDGQNIYNLQETVNIPSNITLQGESGDEGGRCRIYWRDKSWNPPYHPSPAPNLDNCYETATPALKNTQMFRVQGGSSGVRFKDLWLLSRVSGPDCYPREDFIRVETERTVAIALYGNAGNIKDVIVENVSIQGFTWGIRASTCTNPQPDPYPAAETCTQTDNRISDVRIRGYRPTFNTRQLYINSKYAYDWDVQNLNVTTMGTGQGAVEIVSAGRPADYSGENGKLKFMQLNCNAIRQAALFCVQVQKHGGLYFKQLHHEGTNTAIKVLNIAPSGRTNPDPIVFENSVLSGEFYDASMKLYTIGSSIFAAPLNPDPVHQDTGRLKFFGDPPGENPTVVDCGDIHWDVTDIDGWPTIGDDLQMLYTHSERYRGSLFLNSFGYSYVKPHTYCPADINTIGGEHFDTGVMPTESFLRAEQVVPYAHILEYTPGCEEWCDATDQLEGYLYDNPTGPEPRSVKPGAIYIDGKFEITRTLRIPTGKQIIGAPGAELKLTTENIPLFVVDLAISYIGRASGIVIRNLKLKTEETKTTGLSFVGGQAPTPVASSDMHFSGLTLEGFDLGLEARRFHNDSGNPMMDGYSWKNITFLNNLTAVSLTSSNLSNWNVMDLTMLSNTQGAIGWYQKASGNSLQNVRCEGASPTTKMKDCILLEFATSYLTGLKKTVNVTNNLTLGLSPGLGSGIYQTRQTSTVLLRNNDFTASDSTTGLLNILGKSTITSMNNNYTNFAVSSIYAGQKSRVTYCGDKFDGGVAFPDLATTDDNLYVGVPVPTRVKCGLRPMAWDEAITWGGEAGDIPLVGNFYSATRDDFVYYRVVDDQGKFFVKKSNGTDSVMTDLGNPGEIPMTGNFFPGENSRVVIWQPSVGDWRLKEPFSSASTTFHWGMNGDRPFVGNLFKEIPNDPDDKDEVAIYRPSDGGIWIMSPRTGLYTFVYTGIIDLTGNIVIQVGNFLGSSLNHDQVALYNRSTQVWTIFDPDNGGAAFAVSLLSHEAQDVPVAGKYLPGACTQIAVWRPSTQEFRVEDPPFTTCGVTRRREMIWGSKNDPSNVADDDIPLAMTSNGVIHRPTTYRPTKGLYPASIANGQWWVHDAFPTP